MITSLLTNKEDCMFRVIFLVSKAFLQVKDRLLKKLCTIQETFVHLLREEHFNCLLSWGEVSKGIIQKSIVLLLLSLITYGPLISQESRLLVPHSSISKNPGQAVELPYVEPRHGDQYVILSPARLSEDSQAIIERVQVLFQHLITRGEVPNGFISGAFGLSITQALMEHRRFITSTQEIRFLSLEFQELYGFNKRVELLTMLIGESNWLEIELYLELNDLNVWTIINGNVFLRDDRLRL
jgi:hypothetical protein